jgi:hypothetical protein
MRPATKEFPSAEPAMTRQIRAVAREATPFPRKWSIAVYIDNVREWRSVGYL